MGPYEAWATRLRVAFMGAVAQKLWGAFAAVLGDKALSEGRRGNLEHLPGYAEDDFSLALIGSERRLPQGLPEAEADYRERLTQAFQLWKRAGTALGLLVALYAEGFQDYDDVVIIQQNGLWFVLDEPPLQDPPEDGLGVGDGPELIAPMTSDVTPGYSVPAGIPWFTFDSQPEAAARFAILLPNTASLTAEQLARIRGAIRDWKPAKARCVDIAALDTDGRYYGYPVATYGELSAGGATYGDLKGTVTHYSAEA